MIVNQISQYHWQLALVSNKDHDLVVKTGTVYLFLTKFFPDTQPEYELHVDFSTLFKVDICGSCFVRTNRSLVAILKGQCLRVLGHYRVPHNWNKILDGFLHTSSGQFYSNATFQEFTNRTKIIINAFIAKKASTDYKAEISAARRKD